tara:strand:- start:14113 stop:14910 length:798 start_codon:yes stop_codon:yes gene_type:complete
MHTLQRILFFIFLPILSGYADIEDPNEWMMNYYRAPDPASMPEMILTLAESGKLAEAKEQAPLVGFASQVMSANSDQIPEWMEIWGQLPEESLSPVITALWFSNTAEAKEYFAANGLDEYLEADAPNILGMHPDSPGTINLLWGYFFATGTKAPIESLVTTLSLAKYSGALAAYQDSEKSEEDRKAAYLDATFQAALLTLERYSASHPRVLRYCEEIIDSGNLTERENLWLRVAIARAKSPPEEILMEETSSESVDTEPSDSPED